MSDFVQTMKDWRRMCKALGNVSCDGCKLHADGNDCVAVYEGEMDYAKAEKAITAWAAEHQESVYPTWYEVLERFGVAGRINGEAYYDSMGREVYLKQPAFTPRAFEPIPADIAEKLGIEPMDG